MKKVCLVLFIGLIVAVLGACSKLEEGVIVDKKYEESYVTTTMMPIIVSTGKTTTTTLVPMTQYYPESFRIVVEGYDKDGELVREKVYLKEEEYNTYNHGDVYSFDKETLTERPYEEIEQDTASK